MVLLSFLPFYKLIGFVYLYVFGLCRRHVVVCQPDFSLARVRISERENQNWLFEIKHICYSYTHLFLYYLKTIQLHLNKQQKNLDAVTTPL